jgi:hypothetical protein
VQRRRRLPQLQHGYWLRIISPGLGALKDG